MKSCPVLITTWMENGRKDCCVLLLSLIALACYEQVESISYKFTSSLVLI